MNTGYSCGSIRKQGRSGQEAVHPSAGPPLRFPSFRVAALLLVVVTASLTLTACGNSEFYLDLQRLVEQYEAEQGIDLSKGLVAYYPFTSGSMLDESGSGNDGDVPSGYGFPDMVPDRTGAANQAFYFAETEDDLIRCGDDPSTAITGALSITVWIKIEVLNNAHQIVGRGLGMGGSGYCSGYALTYRTDNILQFDTGDSDDYRDQLNSTTTFNDTDWHFIAATWDGTKGENSKKIYIDGVLDNQKECTISEIYFHSDRAKYLEIGNYDTGASWAAFHGSIDEVRVYNRELNEQEVLALYNQ